MTATMAHVEVILRNAIHENLSAWSAERFSEPRWYLDPGGILQPRALEEIREARRRAVRRGRQETPGRVVAELTLGFWRYILSKQYDRTLWRTTLYRAFPGPRSRRMVYDATTILHLCRNRLAHHESIFNRPVDDIRFVALVPADWICPVSRSWIERHCEIEAVLDERP
jgi:hypothetical protein